MSTELRVITTAEAATPTAHYSQAVASGGFVWTAGTVGLDPATGKVVSDAFEDQVHAAIQNVRAALRAAGTDLDQAIKTNCFVTNREDFLLLDAIYSEYFGSPPPGRTTIVCDLVFEELLFEIEVVARVP
jgi:2-iminobutanoate/2-iminopropanoate deaminase